MHRTDAESAPTVSLCGFYVGEEDYVLDIMRIQEILLLQRVTGLPGAPPYVEGVINLRGQIVPVIDVRARLRSGTPRPWSKPKLLVVLVGRLKVALRVDGVSEVMRVKRSDLKPAPSLGAEGGGRFVIGVCGPAGRLRLLLNVKALLSDPAPGTGPEPQEPRA
jgi:purine-binding chemotaxis protein CheW